MNTTDKIAYIVPSKNGIAHVEQALAKLNSEVHVDVMVTDVQNPEGEYRRLCNDGYSCIIARGGMYLDISKYADSIPVVEEKLRHSDILESLAEAGICFDDRAYIILHSNAADNAEVFSTVTKNNIRVHTYNDLQDLKKLIDEIPESGVKVLSSGYAGIVSERKDLEFIVLKNKPETICETVKNAHLFLKQMQENIQQINTLNSIYNNIDEGIIVFDDDYIIIEANTRAIDFIGRHKSEVVGRSALDIIPNMVRKRKGSDCSIDSPRTFMSTLGKYQISYTVYPFKYYRNEVRYLMIMQDVTKIQSLERNIRVQLSKKGLVAEKHFDDIMTCDAGMKRVIDKAKTIASYDGSVLIFGESGTGKELFAQSIHNESNRRNGPFVAINCAALTESLLESELFGYVGGAFTGARKEGKAGLFELAHNGTIFLDEINSTPLSLQTKILRVIESQQVMRVGSDYVIPLNVRIISASNGNLEQDIEEGRFRRDLYYRLNAFELRVPPIRDRAADIIMLFKYYVAKEARNSIKPEDIVLDSKLEQQLLSHNWGGNVREIRSVALRYNAFNGDNETGDILIPRQTAKVVRMHEPVAQEIVEVPQDVAEVSQDIAEGELIKLSELTDAVEKLVIRSLENRGLSRTEIAAELGISRQALYKKLNKMDVE